MSTPSKITEEQVAKLPKWAQAEISALRRDVTRLHAEIKAQQMSEPSSVQWGYNLFDGDATGYLRNDETITFTLTSDPRSRVRIRMCDGRLKVNADAALVIRCCAANDATIGVEP
jgi:hypothetical protein